MASLPKKRIDVSPSEILLDLGSSPSPSTTLTVTNSTDEVLVFKVRTTNPKRYLVKPNQDLLMVGSSVTITIQMQPKDCTELLEAGPQAAEPVTTDDNDKDKSGKDKFMVSTMVVDDSFIKKWKSIKDSGASKDIQNILQDLWENSKKNDIANRRVGCAFAYPPAMNKGGVSASKPPVAKVATEKQPGFKVEKSMSPTPLPAAPAQQNTNSITGIAAAQTQTPGNKADEEMEKTNAAQGYRGEVEATFETVSKQLKETIAILVQVTQERDQFQSKFKEAAKELQFLKEDSRTNRKNGKFDLDLESSTISKSGYQLWHLIIVALVSFLVARLIQFSKNEMSV
jgi:hypothetical protein